MKQEPNNSIDLLLRQLGRQEEVFPSHDQAQHLDADELNSYVANALPAKTRARYMHHLAGCSSCRKMVAQLSAAEGAVVVRQPAAVVGPSGFKSFLASFFSPMVLRYAVPALGVIVITVIGIVMLRQERAGTSIVQVTNTDRNQSVPETPRVTTPAATPVPEQPKEATRAKEAGRIDAAPPAPVTTAQEAAPPPEPEKKAATEADKDAAARDVKSDDAAKAEETARKEKQQEVISAAPATVMSPGNTAPQPRRAKLGEATGAGTGGVASVENAPKSRDFYRAGEEGRGNFAFAETRSVAGRQFRKERDVWIDVAYSANQSTTTVTRGTEQYRALIADEPEIHTIAENLKSEFVVVWKGRAYRVR